MCGYPLRTGAAPAFSPGVTAIRISGLRGIEYRSKITLLGLPLIHIATGFDDNGKKRIARGVIAVGDIALGVFAMGGAAIGGISVGGLSLGALAIGGLALGAVGALGGCAIGYSAIGGCAIGYYAMGGAAFGAHTVSALGADPEAANWFGDKLGGPFKMLKSIPGFSIPAMPKFPK
jgi:hypothetical protein